MKLMKYLAAGALALAGGVTLAQQAQLLPPAATPQQAAPVAVPATAQAPAGPATLTQQDADAWLDGLMPYALRRGDIAGAVVVIVKDGQVLTQRGYGYADVAARKPVDPATTLFRPGSVSKLYTWTSVMQLVEAGKIDLDADINTYLDYKIPALDGKPITMRNVMTHTPGFEENGRDLITDRAYTPNLGEVLKRWTPARVYPAGSTPAYSNHATALAGYIVERVSGMPFDDYVERNIFQRLGMRYASFRQPLPAALEPFMAKGYQLGSGEPKKFETVALAPAGSASISGADMAKFMIAHLDNGGALMRPETAKLMHSPANEIVPGQNRMMLGFYEQKINGLTAIAHGGDTMWFHSNLVLFPERNTGIYISMNSAGKDGAVSPIRGTLLREFADRYLPAATPKAALKELPTAKEHAKLLVGTYANSRAAVNNWAAMLGLMGQFKIGLDKDGRLSIPDLKSIGGAEQTWIEVAPYVWQSTLDGEQFAAKVENGKVVRVVYGPYAPIMVWDPIAWYKDTAWLMPLFLGSLLVIALTALAWPVGAINRRRYGVPLGLAGRELSTYRVIRLFSWLVFAVFGVWAFVLAGMEATMTTSTGLIYFAQILGALVFVGFFGLAIWNAVLAFRSKRGWFSKLWSVLLVAAAFFTLWVALAFHLISLGADW